MDSCKGEHMRWHYTRYFTITPNLESEYINLLLGLKLRWPNQNFGLVSAALADTYKIQLSNSS